MTEDTGFTEPTPEPVPEPDGPEAPPVAGEPDAPPVAAEAVSEPQEAAPMPPVDADPQEVAEEAAGDDEREVVSATSGEPEPMPIPWLPDEGVPDAIRRAIEQLHNRLVALGG